MPGILAETGQQKYEQFLHQDDEIGVLATFRVIVPPGYISPLKGLYSFLLCEI